MTTIAVGTPDAGHDAPPPCNLVAPFGSLVPLRGLPPGVEFGSLTPDERTIYFNTNASNPAALGQEDLVVAVRDDISKDFQSPTWLGNGVNSTAQDNRPWISRDGKSLFFSSNRSSGAGWAIFQATRSDASDAGVPFGNTTQVTGLNVGGNIGSPHIYGNELWYDTDLNKVDIYKSIRNSDGSYTTGVAFELDTPDFAEGNPLLSHDGLTIFFSSDRPGTKGGNDVWMATRKTTVDIFANPTIVAELNTPSSDLPNWISDDGCRIYVNSDVSGDRAMYMAEKPK